MDVFGAGCEKVGAGFSLKSCVSSFFKNRSRFMILGQLDPKIIVI